MRKQVVKLTETDLHNLIKDCINEASKEMDGATYSRMYRASHRAMDDIQNGYYTRTVGAKTTDNDDIITRASSMQTSKQEHWLNDYIGKTFKFFGQDRMGLVAHILFKFEKVTKLDERKAILFGDVVFNDKQINGDGIVLDFTKNKIQYHEKGCRYAYNLQIDNRIAPIWNKFIEQLKMAIESRKPKDKESQTT